MRLIFFAVAGHHEPRHPAVAGARHQQEQRPGAMLRPGVLLRHDASLPRQHRHRRSATVQQDVSVVLFLPVKLRIETRDRRRVNTLVPNYVQVT